jgi:hypothetical protein
MPPAAIIIMITTTMTIEAVLLIAFLILDDRDECMMVPSAITVLKVLLPLGQFENSSFNQYLRFC